MKRVNDIKDCKRQALEELHAGTRLNMVWICAGSKSRYGSTPSLYHVIYGDMYVCENYSWRHPASEVLAPDRLYYPSNRIRQWVLAYRSHARPINV